MNFETTHLVKKIVVYCIPVIILLGLIGNLISIIVFTRKKFQNTIFSTYYRFLVFIDSMALLFYASDKFMDIGFNLSIRGLNIHLCYFFKMSAYVFPSTSGWTLVIISLDRLISILYPAKLLFRKKKQFQMTVCLCVFVYGIIAYTELFFTCSSEPIEYNNGSNVTSHRYVNFSSSSRSERNQKLTDWLDLFNSTVVPSFSMIICSSIVLKKMHDSTKKFGGNISNTKGKKTINRDLKFALTSVVLNLIFLITNTPLCFYALYTNYAPIESNLNKLIFAFLFFLNFFNYSLNFFINFSFNSIFKKEITNWLFRRENSST
jgi:hypothetical protein